METAIAARTHEQNSCEDPSKCPECVFHRRQKFWDDEPWLSTQVEGSKWTVGCTTCAALLKLSEDEPGKVPDRVLAHPMWKKYAKFEVQSTIQRAHLKVHKTSMGHKFAVKMMGKNPVKAMQVLTSTAPTAKNFKQVLVSIRKPGSLHSIPSVGTGRKIQRMTWCLAEARRIKRRAKLRTSKTIALHQDKGQGRLQVRLTACTPDLHGIGVDVGVKKMTGGHREIIETTKEVLQNFCTPGWGRPQSELERRQKEQPKAELDKDLFECIRGKVEMWNTDAASDCSLAGKVLFDEKKAQEARPMSEQGSA